MLGLKNTKAFLAFLSAETIGYTMSSTQNWFDPYLAGGELLSRMAYVIGTSFVGNAIWAAVFFGLSLLYVRLREGSVKLDSERVQKLTTRIHCVWLSIFLLSGINQVYMLMQVS